MTRPQADVGRRDSDDDGAVVQRSLSLVMPVAFDQVFKLREALRDQRVIDLSQRALDRVATVHSTRFLILEDAEQEWAKLCVIATYDGSFDAYIEAFARELGTLFNLLLGFVIDIERPLVPVQDHVDELIDYIWKHDIKPANGRTYRANPDLTVLDIYESTRSERPALAPIR